MFNEKWAFCWCDYETTGVDMCDLPIELGMIFTDHNLEIIDEFGGFIHWPVIQDHFRKQLINNEELSWVSDKWGDGHKYHKIDPVEYLQSTDSKYVTHWAETIVNYTNKLKKERNLDRIILISDNAFFETTHTKLICMTCSNLEFPFHYCTWDTSYFLEILGIGDPDNSPHRALDDVRLLLDHVKTANKLLNDYKNWRA